MPKAKLNAGQALRAYREEQGWTQTDLAGRLGCSKALISDVERGTKEPTLDWWYSTALKIGANPHDLDRRLASIV